MARWAALLLLSVAVSTAAVGRRAGASGHAVKGDQHYFNLEYDEALWEYYQALEVEGESAAVWNAIATTYLYRELNRLGKLDTSAFKGDNAFLKEEKPDPDPEEIKKFIGAMQQARRLAEARLKEAPEDVEALLSLSANYAMQANYEFMIPKSYFSALGNAGTAKKYSRRALKADPDAVDALLVLGVHDYVIGSLPWAVKMIVAIGGLSGDKERGQQSVERVAREGERFQTEARVLMSVLHRREKRPLEAAEILAGLIEDYPRNYVLRLERASMFVDAGEEARALAEFREIRSLVQADRHRLGRMPKRLREALERRVESLAEAVEQKTKTAEASQPAAAAP